MPFDTIEGRRIEAHRPQPRIVVNEHGWLAVASGRRPATGPCSGCGAMLARRIWRSSTRAPVTSRSSRSNARAGDSRRSAHCTRRRSAWNAQCVICSAWSPSDCRTHGRGSTSAFGVSRIRSARAATSRARARPILPAHGGRGPASDSGRPGACRHHRARPLPLHSQWRDRGAAGAAPGLRAQRHRVLDDRSNAGQGRAIGRPHLGRQHRRLCARLRARGRSGARDQSPAACGLSARPDGRARAARQPFRRHRRHLQRCFVLAHARAMWDSARKSPAHGGCLLRSPPDDGSRGAGRRRLRSRRLWRGKRGGVADRGAAEISRADRALRQHRLAAGPYRHHRHSAPGPRPAVRRWRLCRARQRPCVRCA